jgi:inhibitor of KinA
MRIEALGDRAVVLSELPGPAPAVARAIEAARWPGVLDVVPCGEVVGVYSSELFDASLLESLPSLDTLTFTPCRHTIPICFGMGDDLADVASRLDLPVEGLVARFLELEVACFAVGFCPGFAYLGPLPSELSGVPRRATPRTRTEPGSLGITGSQTAVYPLPRPGGWPIIGRTPLTLVDEVDGYFPITVGDVIRFVQIDEAEFACLVGERL